MKHQRKIVILLCVIVLVALCLFSACEKNPQTEAPNNNQNVTPPTHTCESVCATCGKCTNSACTESVCSDKCAGHQATPPAHVCESVCETCGKCTNNTCTESICVDKCQGHQPATPDVSLEEKYEHITIAKALELASAAGETPTTETYTIVGTIVTVSNATYGEMTVADQTGEIYIYGSMASDGTYYDKMTTKPVKGDKVVLTGVLMAYKGAPQMAAKNQKAVIIDWEHVEVEIDVNEYPVKTIAQAREAEKGAKVKVEGIVSAITYANGKVPCGVILVDNGASIYVYNGDVAQQVNVGNKIVVAGTKAYWVLDSEQANAERFGYQGACQIEDALLVSNDNGSHEFDKTWIEEITVKQLMNTEFSQNITSLVFKTTAQIKKVQGTGFVNYYVNDLDGKAGGYTYTQCNGSDFAWLDAFDGKICTVYLTALNAKSTASECFYRLLPIAVEEIQNFTYPEEQLPAFALEYGVVDLFDEKYGANPALELPNSYTAELLGNKTVSLAYSVSDTSLAEIVTDSEKSVLNLKSNGTVTVTITATLGDYTATATKSVTLDAIEDIQTITIAQAIASADGTEVTVKGIVMSSLVNRSGFYLGDETGMIAVLTTADVASQLKPGNQVVMSGYKVHHKKASSTAIAGQCAIVGSITETKDENGVVTEVKYSADSKLVANYYGSHEHDTSYYISGKTIDELYDFNKAIDYTNNVYVVQAKVVFSGSGYSTNVHVKDENGTNQLRLYCSGSGQYSFLQAYDGQVITMELAVCNWNDKNYYTGCVIAVIVDGQRIVNELNFSA